MAVPVHPRVRFDAVVGLWLDPDVRRRLLVVTPTPPDAGEADTAVHKSFAGALRIPLCDFPLLAGEKNRRKSIHASQIADPAGCDVRQAALMEVVT